MSTSPRMKLIQNRLRGLGYDVRMVKTKLVVRLPLSCSVEISEDGDVLRTQPIFGYVSRTIATCIDQLVPFVTLFFWAFYAGSASKLLLPLGVGVLGAWMWDAYRYILTESFITRFQTLVIHELERQSQLPAAMSFPVGTGREGSSQAPVIEIKLHETSDTSVLQPQKAALRTDLIVTCPECGARVLPKADGTCPSCQAEITE